MHSEEIGVHFPYYSKQCVKHKTAYTLFLAYHSKCMNCNFSN